MHSSSTGDNATTAPAADECICRREEWQVGRRVLSPKNCPFALGNLDSHLIHGSLGPPKSTIETASRLVQPFLQGSRLWQTDQATRSEAIGHFYVRSTVMRPENEVQQAALFKHQTLMLHFSKSFENYPQSDHMRELTAMTLHPLSTQRSPTTPFQTWIYTFYATCWLKLLSLRSLQNSHRVNEWAADEWNNEDSEWAT